MWRTGRPYVAPIRVPLLSFSTTDTLSAAVLGAGVLGVFTQQVIVPPNWFRAGRAIRVGFGVNWTWTAVVPTVTVGARFQKAGPTNVPVYAPPAVAPGAQAGDNSQGGFFLLQGTAAPGAAVAVETMIISGGFGNFSRNTLAPSQNIDTTAQQAFQIHLTFSSAAAGNSMTLRQLTAEEMYL